jgi:hypothetical protein
MRRLVAQASAIYFALTFGAGFLLALVRIPYLIPRFGERIAELLEAPVMLAVIFFASRYVVRRFGLASSQLRSVAVGIWALMFLVAAELALGVVLSGGSVAEYISGRDPISGSVYVVSLLLYAVLPWLQARRAKMVVGHEV